MTAATITYQAAGGEVVFAVYVLTAKVLDTRQATSFINDTSQHAYTGLSDDVQVTRRTLTDEEPAHVPPTPSLNSIDCKAGSRLAAWLPE